MGLGLLGTAATGYPTVCVMLGGLLSGMGIGWYHRRFGFARRTKGRALRENVGGVVAVIIVISAVTMDKSLDPPISLTLLAVAVVLAAGQFLALRRVGLTAVHWTVYAVLVVAAFVPLVGVGSDDFLPAFRRVTLGLALVVIGLVDHRRLIRILGGLPEDRTDEQR